MASDTSPLIHPLATFCIPQFKSVSFQEHLVEALLGPGRKFLTCDINIRSEMIEKVIGKDYC